MFDNYRGQFVEMYDYLKQQDVFQVMATIKENSPWHREDNILLHTDMVVGEYLKRAPEEVWTNEHFYGAIAAAFHDVGKPKAMVKKYKEGRGEYLAFGGHEPISSRMFEDFAAKMGWFTNEEVYKICWMIEYHVPWAIKDKTKRENLALTANHIGRQHFINMLLADQFGRISDDQETKLAEVTQWVGEFNSLCDSVFTRFIKDDAPTLYVPIGASGAGKSTLYKNLKDQIPELQPFSLDTYRLDWYSDNYDEAWVAADKDSTFYPRTRQIFLDMTRLGNDIYVDNTNLTKKRRVFYVDEAKKRGYRTVAYTLPCDLQILFTRQKTRGDKQVPQNVVEQQYFSLQQPSLGEFDEIRYS